MVEIPALGAIVSQKINTVPWGLGWAARLAGPNLTKELPPAESYAVILFFGLLALSVPVILLGAVTRTLLFHHVPIGAVMGSAALLNLVSMIIVVPDR